MGTDGGSDGAGPGLYLRGATILTMTGQPPLTGKAVVVRGDRIVALEDERSQTPPELKRIDLDGLTLLPGLLDSHVHMLTGSDVAAALGQCLDYGVTTVKDLCGPLKDLKNLRSDLAAGVLTGPRVFFAGPGFTAPGGHPAGTLYQGNTYWIQNATRTMTDAPSARLELQRVKAAGVDLIKVFVTACEGWGTCGKIGAGVLNAVVDEAHAQGLRVVAHTDSSQDIRDALAAKVDGIEHGVTTQPMDRDIPALVAKAKAYYVPTLGVSAVYGGATQDELVARLSTLRQAGVRIVVGTDADNTGGVYGVSVYHELAFMLKAGFTAIEALTAATRVAAEHLGGGAALGSIEAGKLADLVAVKGDPLGDLTALHQVRLVVLNGKVVRDKL